MYMKNSIVGLKELRQNMDVYIDQVKRGKSLVVVRKSKPIFKMVPSESAEQWEAVANFTEINKHGVSANAILKELRKMDA